MTMTKMERMMKMMKMKTERNNEARMEKTRSRNEWIRTIIGEALHVCRIPVVVIEVFPIVNLNILKHRSSLLPL